jgi:hypothetical protein
MQSRCRTVPASYAYVGEQPPPPGTQSVPGGGFFLREGVMEDFWAWLFLWSTIMFNLGFWVSVAVHHHLVHIARRNRRRWPP